MEKISWITKLAILRFFLAGFETYSIAPTAWLYMKSLHQTKFFLALVLCAHDFASLVSTPLFGFLTDRLGNPRHIYLSSCAVKVVAYLIYSVNLNGLFPLFGRFLSGLGGVGVTVLLAQIALQPENGSRARNFVLVESVYTLGSAFGPAVGSFVTFNVDILGWKIDEGNSPGIVLSFIWLLFLIFSFLSPSDIWIKTGSRSLISKDVAADNNFSKFGHSESQMSTLMLLFDKRIFCLLFLIFCSEAFSSTSTFYVPILALDHFHLQLIHTKLLLLNCSLFTVFVFICLYLASEYLEERKIFVIALFLQIIAITLLTYLALNWDEATNSQCYILLMYVCFGMPFFMSPFGNLLLSKVTDPSNATFVQSLSFAIDHLATVISRVVIGFVFTRESLVYYCFGMAILWLIGFTWYCLLYKRLVPAH